MALTTAAPISVVFNGPMPETFLGREVIDGDVSDLENLFSGNKIIGLKARPKNLNLISSLTPISLRGVQHE